MDCESNRELIAYYRSELLKTVNDPTKDSIVAWSESGKSFIIRDEVEFRKAVLPRGCLVHLGFSQSHEQWEYTCPYFMRGQPDLKPSLISKIETTTKKVVDDGLILLSSLSCYKEMWRLYKKERPYLSSSVRRRPLFIHDVYDMVDDPSTDSVVSWSESGKSFIVWNESKFLGDVLPSRLPFDHKDMTSLTTYLHAIGYSKVEESDHWEYTADYLVRGDPLPRDTSPCTSEGVKITPEFARILEMSFASPKARKQ